MCPPGDGSSGVFDPPLRLDRGRLAWFCVDSWCLRHWAPSRHLHPASRAKAVHLPCVVSWCPQHQLASKGIFVFLQIPDVSLRLASFLVLGVLWGHLHPPSRTKVARCCQLWVSSAPRWPQIIFTLHAQKMSLCLASPLGVLSTGCLPRASPSFTCKPSPFIVCHLLASVARGALPEHLHAPSHASHLHPSRISLSSSCSQH